MFGTARPVGGLCAVAAVHLAVAILVGAAIPVRLVRGMPIRMLTILVLGVRGMAVMLAMHLVLGMHVRLRLGRLSGDRRDEGEAGGGGEQDRLHGSISCRNQ
jgi:hypothetical protein